MKRALSKQGPQTEFAWLVEEGVRAYQRAKRKPTLEGAEAELSGSLGIGVRTLQSWRHTEKPADYGVVIAFVKACVGAAPSLGQRWVQALFRAAAMASYTDQALEDVFGVSPAADGDCTALAEQIVQADAVFQRVCVDEFVGREWLVEKLDAFLNDSTRRSGAFLLVGEAGVGKTSFLSYLVRQRRYLYLFAEQVPGEANLNLALRSLAAQLALRYHIETYTGCETPLADHQLLDRLLRQAASQLEPDEKIVMVCDGLDEAGTMPGGNVLGLPSVLPDGVYLVLSQRPAPVRLSFRSAPHVERLEARMEDNLRDVERYLVAIAGRPEVARLLQAHGYTETDFIRTLAGKSGGVWIYLHYVIGEIMAGSRAPLDLGDLPAGLVGYYTEYWGDWREGLNGRGDGPARWDAVYAPLLATLAAAQEPVSLSQLLIWSGAEATSHEAARLLRERWGAFIAESHNGGLHFSLYHASLRDFIAGEVERIDLSPAGLYLLDDLAERTRRAHWRIVDYYREQCDGDWPQLADDEYARHHLAAHLASAGMSDVLCALVNEGEAHNAWAEVRYSRENTYAGYLADLNLAWHWAESDQWWDVGRQIRCALIQSSVYSLVENVSLDLIYRLIEAGRWKPQEGLAHVLQIPDERQRGTALKRIFPLLPMPLQAKALVAARTMADSAIRAMTLGSLSCELAHESRVSVMREALRVARGITHDAVRVQVLGELSKDVPAELYGDAVEMARGFADEATRALALISLLEHLPDDQRNGIAREVLAALRGMEDESTLAVALKDIGPHLSTSLRAEALAIAREIADDEARARALTGLVKTLAGSQKTRVAREAWRTIRPITDESARAFAIADLAGYLPDDLKAEALEAVQGISNDFVRLFALSELVKHLPGDLATRVIRQALRTVRGMENDIARAMSLLLVGESLPDRLKPEALAVARETADERARAFALSQLVEHLPDDLKSEALIAARKMSNLWARATALSAMVDHVPQAARAGVVADALNAARSISDEWARAIALKGLAEYLPEEFKSQVPQDEIGEQDDGFLAEAIRDTLAATLKGLDAQGQDADEWMADAHGYLATGEMQQALTSAVHAEPVVGNRRAELLAEIASAWKAAGFAELGDERDMWRKTLHALARHRRPELLNDLSALAPLIVRVGGTAALAETFRAVRDVARWWS